MRVLVVVHGFPPTAQGGSELHAEALARAWQRQFGDEILVLTREQDASRPDYTVRREDRNGIRVVWINNLFRQARSFADTYESPRIGAIAAAEIDRFSPAVAHVHHLTCLSTLIVGLLESRGVPVFYTLHDYWLMCHRGQLLDLDYRLCDGPEPGGCGRCLGVAGAVGESGYRAADTLRRVERALPMVASLRRLAARVAPAVAGPSASLDASRARLDHMRDTCQRVTHFLAPSAFMRDRFVRFGIDPAHLTVSPYGVAAEPFTRIRRTSSGQLRLGFLGSLMVSKAPDVLLRAVARLPPGSVSVAIYGGFVPYHGDDSYRAELERWLVQPHVRIGGPVPHEAVPQVMSGIDVLVVPSIWPENSPKVILEALLSGAPVVASRIGGIPEVVLHEQNGLLFEPGDVEGLAHTIRRLLDEPDLLPRLRATRSSVRSLEDEASAVRAMAERAMAARASAERHHVT